MKKYLLLLSCLPLLLGCLPEGNPIPKTKDDIKIISGFLGKEQFFIPDDYVLFQPHNGSMTLEMQIPDFIPLLRTAGQMWRDGEEKKYLRVSILDNKANINFKDYVDNRIKVYRATEKLGVEYGLRHFTQPDGEVKDHDDIWLEEKAGKDFSILNCSDKITPNDVPQCEHTWASGDVYVFVNYDKNNLPQWKIIEENVTKVVNSFESEEKARMFLFQRYQEYKKNNGDQ